MKNNIVETIIGALVISIAVAFALYLYNTNRQQDDEVGYNINARFQDVSGIIRGGDVKIAGIIVGRVSGLELDKDTYLAIVKMNISPEVKIPIDSSISVISNGILGGKYLNITPGAEDDMLVDGGTIKFTQSTISIESLIGKFMLGR